MLLKNSILINPTKISNDSKTERGGGAPSTILSIIYYKFVVNDIIKSFYRRNLLDEGMSLNAILIKLKREDDAVAEIQVNKYL